MSLDSYESIYQQFSSVSAEEWKAKIIKDLRGDAFDKLIWHTKEDIEVLPFYTKEDNLNYQLQIPEKQTKGWQITERIIVDDVLTANKEALHALENGATALVFDLQQMPFSPAEIEGLIKNILVDIAPVTFNNYYSEMKLILESIVKNSCPEIITIPQQETITDELVFALQQGVHKKTNYFSFSIGQNYFFEMAKLRAFRWLWKQVCELNNQPFTLFIQCETSLSDFSKQEENSNILRNTTSAMSAILGGCDSLIINSHDAAYSSFGKRIARNIHHILQRESYFSDSEISADDAAKGSYYIEYLTYQLCKKSWEKFSESGFSK
jgi:methylmalonyl-CoA mutase